MLLLGRKRRGATRRFACFMIESMEPSFRLRSESPLATCQALVSLLRIADSSMKLYRPGKHPNAYSGIFESEGRKREKFFWREGRKNSDVRESSPSVASGCRRPRSRSGADKNWLPCPNQKRGACSRRNTSGPPLTLSLALLPLQKKLAGLG